MPISGRLSSSYGYRVHPILGGVRLHRGIDLAAPVGTPVRATSDGRVEKADRYGGLGLMVELDDGAGTETLYGHMSRLAVTSGARVKKGDVIGYVGSTGLSTGPHLHYEIRRNGEAIDPVSARTSDAAGSSSGR
jgi:murein DD-endopeptidase MepM/ murein hydrolase activator NlpD